MNFGDILAKLRGHAQTAASQAQTAAGQAQKAVVDNKQHIQGAVDKVGSLADSATKGKYTDRITKAGEKAKGMVDKLDTNHDGVVSEEEAAAGAAEGEGSENGEAGQAGGVFGEGAAEGEAAEGEAAYEHQQDQ